MPLKTKGPQDKKFQRSSLILVSTISCLSLYKQIAYLEISVRALFFNIESINLIYNHNFAPQFDFEFVAPLIQAFFGVRVARFIN